MSKFKVGDSVSFIIRPDKTGMVVENSPLTNSNGTHSVRVVFPNKKSRWVIDDNLQIFADDLLEHIHVPDGVFSVVSGKQPPVVYASPESSASQSELEGFAESIQRMWLSKQAA